MTRFIRALESKYQAKIDESLATIDLYLSKPVAIGEHPDILDVLDKYLEELDNNKSKLETLKALVTTEETPTTTS
jgi:hypothetical protein